MKNITKVKKNAGLMLEHKKNLENLASNIKSLERQTDETLQKTVMRSANFIKLNSNLKEINIAIEMLKKALENKNIKQCRRLLKFIQRKIVQTQNMVARHTQKSLLNAVEAMTEAEDNLLMMDNFKKLAKLLEKIEKVWCCDKC